MQPFRKLLLRMFVLSVFSMLSAIHPVSSAVGTSENYKVYLPLIFKPVTGLYGYITEDGQPASQVYIYLMLCEYIFRAGAFACSNPSDLTQTTDKVGMYQFEYVPNVTFPNVDFYRLVYPGEGIEHSLKWWITDEIYYSTDGKNSLQLPAFDIGSIELIKPENGTIVIQPNLGMAITLEFFWHTRTELESDTYGIIIRDKLDSSGANVYFSGNLGYIDSYTQTFFFSNTCDLSCNPPVLRPGKVYEWAVTVANGSGSGESHPYTFAVNTILNKYSR